MDNRRRPINLRVQETDGMELRKHELPVKVVEREGLVRRPFCIIVEL